MVMEGRLTTMDSCDNNVKQFEIDPFIGIVPIDRQQIFLNNH